MNKLLTGMAAEKKQSKKEQQKLELDIKKALGSFTAGIKSKKLEKKIKKYSSDLAGLILKLKEPVVTGKVKKVKTQTKTKAKITPVKQAKKSTASKKK